MQTDVLVVGGGLSGLHTAYELQKHGIDFVLIEARDRLGGRILSRNLDSVHYQGDRPFDLGPAWFWPGQNRMQALVNALGLKHTVFMQFSQGDALYEDTGGGLQRGVDGISMAGAYRLAGGMVQLISRLTDEVKSESVLFDTQLTRLQHAADHVHSTVLSGGQERYIRSRHVVLALPPRLATERIDFVPALSPERNSELNEIATWMAGQAKIVFFYGQPFWRAQGLSGDVISHRGPIQELHDACPDSGGPYALSGFIGVTAQQRYQQEQAITNASIQQLQRLFGPDAASPLDVYLQDWAYERYTAVAKDQLRQAGHAMTNLSNLFEGGWDSRIIWSGSETANSGERNNGYLEGALESSLRTVDTLIQLVSISAD